MQAFGAQLYALRREQGRLAEVEAAATGFIQQYPAVPAWRAAVALIHVDLGKEEDARREFEPLAKDDFAVFPRDGVWPISMAILAELAVYLNDRERAAALYEHLRPRAELTIVVGGLVDCYGSASRYLGLLAGALGRWEDAERHFEDAIEAHQRMGTRRWTGWGQYQYADMLLRRDGAGDRKKALSLLSQALDTAQELGMKALLERALALKLQAQGSRSPTSAHRSTPWRGKRWQSSLTLRRTRRPTAPSPSCSATSKAPPRWRTGWATRGSWTSSASTTPSSESR